MKNSFQIILILLLTSLYSHDALSQRSTKRNKPKKSFVTNSGHVLNMENIEGMEKYFRPNHSAYLLSLEFRKHKEKFSVCNEFLFYHYRSINRNMLNPRYGNPFFEYEEEYLYYTNKKRWNIQFNCKMEFQIWSKKKISLYASPVFSGYMRYDYLHIADNVPTSTYRNWPLTHSKVGIAAGGEMALIYSISKKHYFKLSPRVEIINVSSLFRVLHNPFIPQAKQSSLKLDLQFIPKRLVTTLGFGINL